jgi:chromosome segregation ATPase
MKALFLVPLICLGIINMITPTFAGSAYCTTHCKTDNNGMAGVCAAEAIPGGYGCLSNCDGVRAASGGMTRQIDSCVHQQRAHKKAYDEGVALAEAERHRNESERQAAEATRHRNAASIANEMLRRARLSLDTAETELAATRDRALIIQAQIDRSRIASAAITAAFDRLGVRRDRLQTEYEQYVDETTAYEARLGDILVNTTQEIERLAAMHAIARDVAANIHRNAAVLDRFNIELTNVHNEITDHTNLFHEESEIVGMMRDHLNANAGAVTQELERNFGNGVGAPVPAPPPPPPTV